MPSDYLQNSYAPASRDVLLQAGLAEGMKVADFGCGSGVVTRMLAEIVGPSGQVTAVDVNHGQLRRASEYCKRFGLANISFQWASACEGELFDFVYCRFHSLQAGLYDIRDVVKPGGIIVIEDGDPSARILPDAEQWTVHTPDCGIPLLVYCGAGLKPCHVTVDGDIPQVT